MQHFPRRLNILSAHPFHVHQLSLQYLYSPHPYFISLLSYVRRLSGYCLRKEPTPMKHVSWVIHFDSILKLRRNYAQHAACILHYFQLSLIFCDYNKGGLHRSATLTQTLLCRLRTLTRTQTLGRTWTWALQATNFSALNRSISFKGEELEKGEGQHLMKVSSP